MKVENPSLELMKQWMNEAVGTPNVRNSELLERVRKITLNPEFRALCNKTGEVPVTSMVAIPRVKGDVPRGFIHETVIPVAQIIVFSQMIEHRLTPEETEKIYKDHCFKLLAIDGRAYRLTDDESIQVLTHYMSCLSLTTGRNG